MRVIVLSGAYNSGKTTVLKRLTATLLGMGGRMIAKVVHGHDERCAILFKRKTVGVCSGGDDANTVRDNFAFFAVNKCDVGISACRSVAGCGSVNAVKSCAYRLNKQLPYYVGKMRESRSRMAAVDIQAVNQIAAMI